MKLIKLGNTGTFVSRICLGCMSFGDRKAGAAWQQWVLGEEEARSIIREALEAGVNFFDTANSYTAGTSEMILGRALRDFANRDEVVVATKVFSQVREGPNGSGLSRKAVMQEIDNSLKRLGMEYVDLYQVHRWDYNTPIEETMEALNDVVKAGKARYIGASSMYAWQFAKAQHIAASHGWQRFVSMQDLYNLIYREEEREMYPLCTDQKVAVIPWSPLAKGRLARQPGQETERSSHDVYGSKFFPLQEESDIEIIRRVAEVAGKRSVSMAQVALAWVLSKPFVTAPIVGFTSLDQMRTGLAAEEMRLSDEEIAYLEEPYTPHAVVGFS